MKFFKELPTVFPFYAKIEHQEERIENRQNSCPFKLLSPRNALLPFQIEFDVSMADPIGWSVISICGNIIKNINIKLPKIKIYEFPDRKVAVYDGTALSEVGDEISTIFDLACGRYYSKLDFAGGKYFVSEIFTVPENRFGAIDKPAGLLRIDFWNDNDVKPLLYRDNFKQTIFLDTFVHTATPEVEEDSESDGNGSDVATFSKLILKYKFSDDVPDFVKIGLISLQMTDHVLLSAGGRSGEVDRVRVTATPDDSGSNIIDVVFENDIIIKTACGKNETAVSVHNVGD